MEVTCPKINQNRGLRCSMPFVGSSNLVKTVSGYYRSSPIPESFSYRPAMTKLRLHSIQPYLALREWCQQGRIKSEGLHEDTGSRAPITERDWQSHHVDVWENRLINPMKGTRKEYPWITAIEVNASDIEGFCGEQTGTAPVQTTAEF